MAEEVEMTPVEAVEPPKANPLAKPAAKIPTVAAAPALRPGLKLPPKPGATTALKPGLKLPPKPGATVALKPGLRLPSQGSLKPGLKLPTKPMIRKPGEATVAAKPLPKPVAVDAQGVGKLPTVEAKSVAREDAAPVVSENPKPMEALKSVTQKLKGLTQEIPAQAILHKTGIIADVAMSDSQKEAAKHKTARISLSDAMGVAPVKEENAPIKTIRIKRPVGIVSPTGAAAHPPVAPVAPVAPAAAPEAVKPAETPAATAPTETAEAPKPATSTDAVQPTVTQRKTLRINRPGGVVRPSGKFTTIKKPTATAASPAADVAAGTPPPVADMGAVADIPDIPAMPMAPVASVEESEGPSWLFSLSTAVQIAACVVIGVLGWLLYQNTQTAYF